jgi:hypothetical protein
MEEDTVVSLPRPGASVTDDPLLVVLRDGARRMLMQAIEAEVEAFLAIHAGLMDHQGRRRVVRPVSCADLSPRDRAKGPMGTRPNAKSRPGSA